MRRALAIVAAAGVATASVAAATGPAVDQASFRYVRALSRTGAGPSVIEPDAPLFAHTRPGFSDLRIVDPEGRQVAWRPYPEAPATSRRPLGVVYRGTRDGVAVALLDAGPSPPRLDELELDLPARDFVGRADVLGSDDRKAFTKLSSTVVYDIEGARAARSTAAAFPPASVRYYLVRVSGVPRVTGATATVATDRPYGAVTRRVRSVTVTEKPRRTVVTLDLGFRRVPVDRLRLASSTRIYDRTIEIRESDDSRIWYRAAFGRAFRVPGSVDQVIEAGTASRYVRLVIENGDDRPLAGLAVTALADSRAIVVRGGEPGPLRLLYGNRSSVPPEYDFARLPASAIGLGSARPAALGAERRVRASIAPPDVETFFERHDWVVPALLGLAAIGIGAAGLVAALRPRRPGDGATVR